MADYTNKLIDFMYVDRPKVSSLLAQFLSEGLVVEQNASTQIEHTKTTGLEISSKIAGLLGISASHERASADQSSESVRKNPEWAQAKALVQYVSDAHDQNCGKSLVGSLKILSGKLQIFDLTPFRQIVDNERLMSAIKSALFNSTDLFGEKIKQIDAAIEALDSSAVGKAKSKELPARKKELNNLKAEEVKKAEIYKELTVEGISQFVRHSPFSIVAILETDDDKYWFSLKQESLLHDQGDTLLKFGYSIDGQWSVACIVDGEKADLPDFSTVGDENSEDAVWATIVRPFVYGGRMAVGRPSNYRSLMPLVVFRSLGEILR